MAAFGGFRELGTRPRKLALPGNKPKGVKTSPPKALNYNKIKEDVYHAISQLSADEQAKIPAGATLPEAMTALALVWLGYMFVAQRAEDGGRLRIGGAVVDFLVYVGGRPTVLRVQGDYWHSLPERKRSDLVQAERLRAKHYRVADLWEHELYQAWVEGHLKTFVEQAVMNAT